jgi:ribose transport system substrate-binding protein
MKQRRWILLAAAGAALAGCVQNTPPAGGPSTTPATGAAGTTAGKKGPDDRLKIAVVPKGTTHEFWQTIHAGAEAAGKEFNAEILWNGPKAETDIQDQIDIINTFATQGVDGIALAATSKDTLVQTVKDLQAKGIAVVTIDSGIEPDVSSSFIATDNVQAAAKAAKELGRLLDGKGKVAILSFLKGAGTSDQRDEGFMEGIKEFPGIKVVGNLETKSDSAKAAEAMESLLSANPDLAGVFASNEPNVVGATGVLKAKNLIGKVKLVGFDASAAEIKALKEGTCLATVVQDPFKMGYEGVKAIAQIVRGQGTPEKRIDTGATLVTKANMDEPAVHKLLFPLEDAGK